MEVWGLEPAIGGEAEESGGDGSWERGQACCAAQSCAFVCGMWENWRESSPASTERSEVIGLRDSPSIAEGRAGS